MARAPHSSKLTAFIASFMSSPMTARTKPSAREKQLKRWKRDWKIELIERDDPEWRDLSDMLV
jgi:putative endonuclease